MSAPGSGWAGRRVLALGAGISGLAAIRALHSRDVQVLVADRQTGLLPADLITDGVSEIGVPDQLPDVDLVLATPGAPPSHPLLVQARAAGVEVIGEPELAWRLRGPDPGDWLVVTGTNGKTTTVGMLEAILLADGRRAVAAGNIGLPLVEVVAARPPYDTLAVELSSFQLERSPSIRPIAATVLNVAVDHLDWHGSAEAYAAAKALALTHAAVAVVNLDEPASRAAAAGHPNIVGFTVSPPPMGAVGFVDGALVDRRDGEPVRLAEAADLPMPGPHNLANALAAATLARIAEVAPEAVSAGLRSFRPAAHRNALVGTVEGVAYVDDSKATNPHAAQASLSAYTDVVWIAGGLLKGATVEELVRAVRHRLRAVVLLGAERGVIADALARHAPEIPVVEVTSSDDGAMAEVVAMAAGLAAPGSTVLLAPAAASWDMFTDYGARGTAFAAAVADRVRS